MAYIGSSPTKVVSRQSANIFTYTATANQTAFTGADANGNTLACSPSDIMVHMNGLRLEESDYTATTTTVTLGSGAAAGDEVTITAFLTFESADHYDKSTSDTRYVNTTGDTMTGALAVDAGNGDQLTLDNDGERFTQISLKNNGSQYAAVWYDNSINVLVNHAASGKGYVVQTGGSTDRLVIDSSGRVTMPYQPSFSYTSNSAWAINTTTQEKFTSSNVFSAGVPAGFSHNTGNHFNASTGTFTAPIAGRYKFHASTTMYNFTSGYFYIYIYVNNNQSAYKQFSQQSSTMAQGVIDIILDLSANDYVDARWINNYTTPTIIYTTFSGYLIG